MKNLILNGVLALTLAFGVFQTRALAADAFRPSTVIHVINVKWKKDATKAQIQAALDGLDKLHKAYPGLLRVWTRTFKFQLDGLDQMIVMEFASKEALEKYADSAAQKEWYKLYLPIREESRTNDATN